MQYTSNYGLNKPEAATDNVNIDILNDNADIIDKGLVVYLGTTSGSANTYALTSTALKALSEGLAVCVKFNAASTAASTLNINSWGAKGIKKPNGSDVTNLKAGMYTLRYDGTNFILQGEGASGNATASDLLLGKTATTDAGDITGTLELTGDAVASQVPAGKTFYNNNPKSKITGTAPIKTTETFAPKVTEQVIAAGQYLSGAQTIAPTTGTATPDDALAGKTFNSGHGIGLSGNIPSKAAATITPGTSDQTIAAGQYLAGNQTVKGDPNLVPQNLPEGITIFDVLGTMKRLITGDAVVSSDDGVFYNYSGGGLITNQRKVTASGLPFKPRMIVVYFEGGGTYLSIMYNKMGATEMLIYVNGATGSTATRFTMTGDAQVWDGGFRLPIPLGYTNAKYIVGE
jgi:hypothetical protein